MQKSLRINTFVGIGTLLLIAISRCFGADNSPDTTAKYLAGLAVPAAAVDAPANDNPWVLHSAELDRAWKRADEQMAAIASWAPNFLGPAYHGNATMFYMFSGPDFLYAHAFFPNAGTYIFCGNEPVGALPDLSKIAPAELPLALANVRKSLGSVLNWSFFITKDMKTDLSQAQLSGTLPLLYVFLARAGCSIESVSPVTIDKAGVVMENDKGQTPGVRIVFQSSSNPPQTLYYFCSDLSDDGIASKPEFLRFCEQQSPGESLLKAASYLMFEPGFGKVRDFLLAKSELILQDDSGIPFKFFERGNWEIRFCGPYLGPIDTFKKYWQPDLAEQSSKSVPVALPFGFGYQWQPSRSNLMIVTRREAQFSRVRNDGSSG